MHKDRELLELAAKAGGLRIEYWTEDSSGDVPVAVLENGDFWQPLLLNTHTDFMGDALRLAVRLDLDVLQAVTYREAQVAGALQRTIMEPWGEDKAAATCRAIVLAAAEIGRVSHPKEGA